MSILKIPLLHRRPIHHIKSHLAVYNPARHLKWGMIHAALILFFADMVAAFWPAFDHVWSGHAKIVIAIASFSASVTEYFAEHKEGEVLRRWKRLQEYREALQVLKPSETASNDD